MENISCPECREKMKKIVEIPDTRSTNYLYQCPNCKTIIVKEMIYREGLWKEL